ncbi:MAG: hypothetical protein IKV41_04880, partial [Oscillospiraceae bacterium]|nr:hypothetical protein [Oscillospiraceae bacterium]
ELSGVTGAQNIGTAVSGLSGTNVGAVLAQLKALCDKSVVSVQLSGSNLIATLKDGTKTTISLAKFSDSYAFNDSGQIDFTVTDSGSSHTVTAGVKSKSITLGHLAVDAVNELSEAVQKAEAAAEKAQAIAGGDYATTPELTAHTSNKSNPHGVTAAQVGAIPWTDARSADYDMDVIIQQIGDYSWYRVDANTLGTPYKYGVSTFAYGWVLSCVSSATYGYQIAFLSGTKTPFMRYKQSGTVSDWTTGYLPLYGGTLLGDVTIQKNGYPSVRFDNTYTKSKGNIQHIGNSMYMTVGDNDYSNDNISLGISNRTGYSLANSARVIDYYNGVYTHYTLYGQHNKPTGTYTGTGSSTERTINVGGIGRMLLLTSSKGSAVLTNGSGILFSANEVRSIKANEAIYKDGVITLTTADDRLNASGVTYTYQVI